MPAPLRIVVADDEPKFLVLLQTVLQRLGHEVFPVANGRQLVEACRTIQPDLVIADVKMPEMDRIEAAEQLSQTPVPIILVSGYADDGLLARVGTGNIMAYLVKPVEEADLKTAIAVALARFEQQQRIEQEAAQLRQSLRERSVIERAKGILMKRLGLDEATAFLRLRKAANASNRKLIETAREIIAAEDVFGQFEDS